MTDRTTLTKTEQSESWIALGAITFIRATQFHTDEQFKELQRLDALPGNMLDVMDTSKLEIGSYCEFDQIFGLPFPAFLYRTTMADDNARRQAFDFNRLTGQQRSWPQYGITVRGHSGTLWGKAFLPLRPYLPGFILNALFWASVAWLCTGGFSRWRKRRRERAGLCAKCGYPRGGSGGPCSECGAAVASAQVCATAIPP